jgi:hypothetical protein
MVDDAVKGRAAGGFARAEALTKAERKSIATRAAEARWAKSAVPIATHEGVLRIGDVDIPCAVLEDGRRVLTQSGVMKAMGRARQAKGRRYYDSDDQLPAFLQAKNLKPFISSDLVLASKHIEFRTVRGAHAFGYVAELLPKVCDVFVQALDARPKTVLKATQMHIAERAKILIRALAQTAIVALVDEATGYQEIRPRDALQKYLELIVRKELAAWVKKFPDEFYQNIYTLKGWTWPGMSKNRYSVVAHYTRDLVYERMAPGLLQALEQKAPKNDKGRRNTLLKDWLTGDIGDPMLAQHLHSLIMFQRLSIANGYGWKRFVNMVDQVLPKKDTSMLLPFLESSPVES